MANANRPSVPNPTEMQKQVKGNTAPFSPQTLVEVAPGGSVMKKGDVNSYFNGDECEKGTGDKKPVWP